MIHPLLKKRTISLETAVFTVVLSCIASPIIIVLSSVIASPFSGCV